MMSEFEFDPEALAAKRERSSQRSLAREGAELAVRLAAGESLDDESLAVLFLDDEVTTAGLLQLASKLRTEGAPNIETFAPLYISNECDAECKMCGMRSLNKDLHRATADAETVRDQLDVLHRRGLRGVAILTGEYRHGARRDKMLAQSALALRDALDRGFTHVLINIGSLEVEEYDQLLAEIPRGAEGGITPQVTMCTFQETYEPGVYKKFMGDTPLNPRSDFDRRLHNFDRAADAGMRFANPGMLVGLNPDLAFELLALMSHIRHLEARGMSVYISLPRLRKASGAEHSGGATDDELLRLVCVLSAGFPAAKVVISTRE
jgi:2-iminoacetate synthase